MRVQSENFHVMLGHVEDGCEIVSPSGKVFTLKNTIRGWQVLGADGQPCSGNLESAYEVEMFIVHGLQTH